VDLDDGVIDVDSANSTALSRFSRGARPANAIAATAACHRVSLARAGPFRLAIDERPHDLVRA
jgi:hypothetical protein